MDATSTLEIIAYPITSAQSVMLGALPDIMTMAIGVFLVFLLSTLLLYAVSGEDDWPSDIPKEFPKYDQQNNKWTWM